MARLRLSASETGLSASEVNARVQKVLGRKVESITKHPQLRQSIGRCIIVAVTPLVPKDTGELRKDAQATKDGRLIWSAVSYTGEKPFNYAPYQYYLSPAESTTNTVRGKKYTRPYRRRYKTEGTKSHWMENWQEQENVDAAAANAEIAELIIKEFNNG